MQVNFNDMAAQYSRNRRANPDVVNGLAESSRINEGSKVLDVGCGTGDCIIALTEQIGCLGWGVDPSEQMLATAIERSDKVTFQVGMGEKLDFPDDHFDFVFSVNVMHHMKGHREYFGEAMRVLKPGGLICTVTHAQRVHRETFPDPIAVYFPQSEIDSYPEITELLNNMNGVQFGNIREDFILGSNQVTDITPYIEKSFSPLLKLDEEAFRQGIEKMKEDLKKGNIEFESKASLLWGTVKDFE